MNPNVSPAECASSLCTNRFICATFVSMRRFAVQGILALFACGLFLLPTVQAQDLEAFEKAVTEFDLDNGLHFIVLERRQAPVISFRTLADVGSVDDPAGQTGMAHMFEHMAFKGTPTIGTKTTSRNARRSPRWSELISSYRQSRERVRARTRTGLQRWRRNFSGRSTKPPSWRTATNTRA